MKLTDLLPKDMMEWFIKKQKQKRAFTILTPLSAKIPSAQSDSHYQIQPPEKYS